MPGVAAVDEAAMEAVIAADSEKARTLLARELEEMVTREMLKLDALQLMVTVATVACIPPKRGWSSHLWRTRFPHARAQGQNVLRARRKAIFKRLHLASSTVQAAKQQGSL